MQANCFLYRLYGVVGLEAPSSPKETEPALEPAEVHPFRNHRRGTKVPARGVFDGAAGRIGRVEGRPVLGPFQLLERPGGEARRAELRASFSREGPQACEIWEQDLAHGDRRAVF